MEILSLRYQTAGKHSFPESIDIDQRGNLFVSESYEGALYWFKRRVDGSLEPESRPILSGLGRGGARGISIDRETDILYFAVAPQDSEQPQIVGIPLGIFHYSQKLPLTLNECKALAEELSLAWWQVALPARPNGVVYVSQEQALYYAHTRLVGGYLLGRKGFVEKVPLNRGQPAETVLKARTPNGLDRISATQGGGLLLTLSAQNSVCLLDLRDGSPAGQVEIELQSGGHWLLGHAPDGVHARSDGSALVAGFASGKITLLPWKDRGFDSPVTLVPGLGNPTDLVTAPGSRGNDRSLFVTAMQPFLTGKVFEIPAIDRALEAWAGNGPGEA